MPIEHVYLSSHCHVDLGYTDHVEALWGFFDAAIERALDLIDETADHPPEAQFRYTCEVTCIVEHFLAHAPPRQVDRLIRAERDGKLDVGGMWAHRALGRAALVIAAAC